ncbi:DUF3558 domain-containing protein [Saccharothrix australiensis]|uniref:Uncharacterized protein DUF3558 n=1 Tax=Saccharothrix australiensis TaxID=2072 RepID=A0A495VVE5_9PSEU|nr:DUF3558 domain-containing protein [Saccharothrix australiensis]RKT51608.1 uncharacterized protein DUF3558 [Saccharothrix australiensis]
MRLAKPAALAVLAAVLLAGCGNEPGTPTPEPPTGTTGTTTTKSSAPREARPKELKLSGVDPCALLPEAKRKEWGTSRTDNRPTEVVKGKPAPSCSFRTGPGVLPSFEYNVSLVPEGYGYWDESGNLDVNPAKVSGFPAVQVNFAGTTRTDCFYAVDVADGEQLYVQFLPNNRDFDQAQMCQKAEQATEVALATLQTLK